MRFELMSGIYYGGSMTYDIRIEDDVAIVAPAEQKIQSS